MALLAPPSSAQRPSTDTTTLTYDLRLLRLEGTYAQGPDGAVHDVYRGSPKGRCVYMYMYVYVYIYMCTYTMCVCECPGSPAHIPR